MLLIFVSSCVVSTFVFVAITVTYFCTGICIVRVLEDKTRCYERFKGVSGSTVIAMADGGRI